MSPEESELLKELLDWEAFDDESGLELSELELEPARTLQSKGLVTLQTEDDEDDPRAYLTEEGLKTLNVHRV